MSSPFGGKDFAARNCAGMDTNLFFPDETEVVKAEAAKAVCDGCVVREACLEFALVNVIREGIYGGASERARRRIRASRKQARQIAS